jgi:hypothetical protein
MSIQPVGTGGIGPTLGADPSNFITPDSLMAYCESRMSSLDSQMKTAFAQQTKTNEDSQALTWLQSALANCSQGGIAQGGSGNNHAGSDLVRAFEVTINKVGRDTELGKKLVAQQGTSESHTATTASGRIRRPRPAKYRSTGARQRSRATTAAT